MAPSECAVLNSGAHNVLAHGVGKSTAQSHVVSSLGSPT